MQETNKKRAGLSPYTRLCLCIGIVGILLVLLNVLFFGVSLSLIDRIREHDYWSSDWSSDSDSDDDRNHQVVPTSPPTPIMLSDLVKVKNRFTVHAMHNVMNEPLTTQNSRQLFVFDKRKRQTQDDFLLVEEAAYALESSTGDASIWALQGIYRNGERLASVVSLGNVDESSGLVARSGKNKWYGNNIEDDDDDAGGMIPACGVYPVARGDQGVKQVGPDKWVGIHTSTPSLPFDVNSNAKVRGYLKVCGNLIVNGTLIVNGVPINGSCCGENCNGSGSGSNVTLCSPAQQAQCLLSNHTCEKLTGCFVASGGQPSCVFEADPSKQGWVCDDHNDFTESDECDAYGHCVGTPVDVFKPCDIDTCPPDSPGGCLTNKCVQSSSFGNMCLAVLLPDGTNCTDNNVQTINDVCVAGVCRGFSLTDDEVRDCTVAEKSTCELNNPGECRRNLCVFFFEIGLQCSDGVDYSKNGLPCNDNDPDTPTSFCYNGACVGEDATQSPTPNPTPKPPTQSPTLQPTFAPAMLCSPGQVDFLCGGPPPQCTDWVCTIFYDNTVACATKAAHEGNMCDDGLNNTDPDVCVMGTCQGRVILPEDEITACSFDEDLACVETHNQCRNSECLRLNGIPLCLDLSQNTTNGIACVHQTHPSAEAYCYNGQCYLVATAAPTKSPTQSPTASPPTPNPTLQPFTNAVACSAAEAAVECAPPADPICQYVECLRLADLSYYCTERANSTANNQLCDDGHAETINDRCHNGVCRGLQTQVPTPAPTTPAPTSPPFVQNIVSNCTMQAEFDVCDSLPISPCLQYECVVFGMSTVKCLLHVNISANNQPCDDGHAETLGDRCYNGECSGLATLSPTQAPSPPYARPCLESERDILCGGAPPQCREWSCVEFGDGSIVECATRPKNDSNGDACDDQQANTFPDICVYGECIGNPLASGAEVTNCTNAEFDSCLNKTNVECRYGDCVRLNEKPFCMEVANRSLDFATCTYDTFPFAAARCYAGQCYLIATSSPTQAPTLFPTNYPTKLPTVFPTKLPTVAPTPYPTRSPTMQPTLQPSSRVCNASEEAQCPPAAQCRFRTCTHLGDGAIQCGDYADYYSNATCDDGDAGTIGDRCFEGVCRGNPTQAPTNAPTKQPTKTPTKTPTGVPTKLPTAFPTKAPTMQPTLQPSARFCTLPSEFAQCPTPAFCLKSECAVLVGGSVFCSQIVDIAKEGLPCDDADPDTTNSTCQAGVCTGTSTAAPTSLPTRSPTKSPTKYPTKSPTFQPTALPTPQPTLQPILNSVPCTALETATQCQSPAQCKYVNCLKLPSGVYYCAELTNSTANNDVCDDGLPETINDRCFDGTCRGVATLSPTNAPTNLPTKIPTLAPTNLPTKSPTKQPTKFPTQVPTSLPTASPTLQPTLQPASRVCTPAEELVCSAMTQHPCKYLQCIVLGDSSVQCLERTNYTANFDPCNDGLSGTLGDFCWNGVCVGIATAAPTSAPTSQPTAAPLVPTLQPTSSPLVPDARPCTTGEIVAHCGTPPQCRDWVCIAFSDSSYACATRPTVIANNTNCTDGLTSTFPDICNQGECVGYPIAPSANISECSFSELSNCEYEVGPCRIATCTKINNIPYCSDFPNRTHDWLECNYGGYYPNGYCFAGECFLNFTDSPTAAPTVPAAQPCPDPDALCGIDNKPWCMRWNCILFADTTHHCSLTVDYAQNTFGCDDYNVNTFPDICVNGTCVGNPLNVNQVGNCSVAQQIECENATNIECRYGNCVLLNGEPFCTEVANRSLDGQPCTYQTYPFAAATCQAGQCYLVATASPTHSPTASPTIQPTLWPTFLPTMLPTLAPTQKPTRFPTLQPTPQPASRVCTPTEKLVCPPAIQCRTVTCFVLGDGAIQCADIANMTDTSPCDDGTPTTINDQCYQGTCRGETTAAPTKSPTFQPTNVPTNVPTKLPTSSPTKQPSKAPTFAPTDLPTKSPTPQPTLPPLSRNCTNAEYTLCPLASVCRRPQCAILADSSLFCAEIPDVSQNGDPCDDTDPDTTASACLNGVCVGTATDSPTAFPTKLPTFNPTQVPTKLPTFVPTYLPTVSPTRIPTAAPTMQPTLQPIANAVPCTLNQTLANCPPASVCRIMNCLLLAGGAYYCAELPDYSPSVNGQPCDDNLPFTINEVCADGTCIGVSTLQPTNAPTNLPTRVPTNAPTKFPTKAPTQLPTKFPTLVPTNLPTASPTLQPTLQPSTSICTAPADLAVCANLTQYACRKYLCIKLGDSSVQCIDQPDYLQNGKGPCNDGRNETFDEFCWNGVCVGAGTLAPTAAPTLQPTQLPTQSPTQQPTGVPTLQPTLQPVPAGSRQCNATELATCGVAPQCRLLSCSVQSDGYIHCSDFSDVSQNNQTCDDQQLNTFPDICIQGECIGNPLAAGAEVTPCSGAEQAQCANQTNNECRYATCVRLNAVPYCSDAANRSLDNQPCTYQTFPLADAECFAGQCYLVGTNAPTGVPTFVPTKLPTVSPTLHPTASPVILTRVCTPAEVLATCNSTLPQCQLFDCIHLSDGNNYCTERANLALNGLPCNDGNANTVDDTCYDGVCSGIESRACNATEVALLNCTQANMPQCREPNCFVLGDGSLHCKDQPAYSQNGDVCDDGDPDTPLSVCVNGECRDVDTSPCTNAIQSRINYDLFDVNCNECETSFDACYANSPCADPNCLVLDYNAYVNYFGAGSSITLNDADAINCIHFVGSGWITFNTLNVSLLTNPVCVVVESTVQPFLNYRGTDDVDIVIINKVNTSMVTTNIFTIGGNDIIIISDFGSNIFGQLNAGNGNDTILVSNSIQQIGGTIDPGVNGDRDCVILLSSDISFVQELSASTSKVYAYGSVPRTSLSWSSGSWITTCTPSLAPCDSDIMSRKSFGCAQNMTCPCTDASVPCQVNSPCKQQHCLYINQVFSAGISLNGLPANLNCIIYDALNPTYGLSESATVAGRNGWCIAQYQNLANINLALNGLEVTYFSTALVSGTISLTAENDIVFIANGGFTNTSLSSNLFARAGNDVVDICNGHYSSASSTNLSGEGGDDCISLQDKISGGTVNIDAGVGTGDTCEQTGVTPITYSGCETFTLCPALASLPCSGTTPSAAMQTPECLLNTTLSCVPDTRYLPCRQSTCLAPSSCLTLESGETANMAFALPQCLHVKEGATIVGDVGSLSVNITIAACAIIEGTLQGNFYTGPNPSVEPSHYVLVQNNGVISGSVNFRYSKNEPVATVVNLGGTIGATVLLSESNPDGAAKQLRVYGCNGVLNGVNFGFYGGEIIVDGMSSIGSIAKNILDSRTVSMYVGPTSVLPTSVSNVNEWRADCLQQNPCNASSPYNVVGGVDLTCPCTPPNAPCHAGSVCNTDKCIITTKDLPSSLTLNTYPSNVNCILVQDVAAAQFSKIISATATPGYCMLFVNFDYTGGGNSITGSSNNDVILLRQITNAPAVGAGSGDDIIVLESIAQLSGASSIGGSIGNDLIDAFNITGTFGVILQGDAQNDCISGENIANNQVQWNGGTETDHCIRKSSVASGTVGCEYGLEECTNPCPSVLSAVGSCFTQYNASDAECNCVPAQAPCHAGSPCDTATCLQVSTISPGGTSYTLPTYIDCVRFLTGTTVGAITASSSASDKCVLLQNLFTSLSATGGGNNVIGFFGVSPNSPGSINVGSGNDVLLITNSDILQNILTFDGTDSVHICDSKLSNPPGSQFTQLGNGDDCLRLENLLAGSNTQLSGEAGSDSIWVAGGPNWPNLITQFETSGVCGAGTDVSPCALGYFDNLYSDSCVPVYDIACSVGSPCLNSDCLHVFLENYSDYNFKAWNNSLINCIVIEEAFDYDYNFTNYANSGICFVHLADDLDSFVGTAQQDFVYLHENIDGLNFVQTGNGDDVIVLDDVYGVAQLDAGAGDDFVYAVDLSSGSLAPSSAFNGSSGFDSIYTQNVTTTLTVSFFEQLCMPNAGFPTSSPTRLPTGSPTKNPTAFPTPQPTNFPTPNPTLATNAPTLFPTNNPTASPTRFPTNQPTKFPTNNPTASPTRFPTNQPTKFPTNQPSTSPTKFPTNNPTASPTRFPTNQPTNFPTDNPTLFPTEFPTSAPTASPVFASSPCVNGYLSRSSACFNTTCASSCGANINNVCLSSPCQVSGCRVEEGVISSDIFMTPSQYCLHVRSTATTSGTRAIVAPSTGPYCVIVEGAGTFAFVDNNQDTAAVKYAVFEANITLTTIDMELASNAVVFVSADVTNKVRLGSALPLAMDTKQTLVMCNNEAYETVTLRAWETCAILSQTNMHSSYSVLNSGNDTLYQVGTMLPFPILGTLENKNVYCDNNCASPCVNGDPFCVAGICYDNSLPLAGAQTRLKSCALQTTCTSCGPSGGALYNGSVCISAYADSCTKIVTSTTGNIVLNASRPCVHVFSGVTLSGAITADPGIDTCIVVEGTVTASVFGSSGKDVVLISNGASVAAAVSLGNGDDLLFVSDATFGNQVSSGAGNDVLKMCRFTMTAVSVATRQILGSTEDDCVIVTEQNSDVGLIDGGSGSDNLYAQGNGLFFTLPINFETWNTACRNGVDQSPCTSSDNLDSRRLCRNTGGCACPQTNFTCTGGSTCLLNDCLIIENNAIVTANLPIYLLPSNLRCLHVKPFAQVHPSTTAGTWGIDGFGGSVANIGDTRGWCIAVEGKVGPAETRADNTTGIRGSNGVDYIYVGGPNTAGLPTARVGIICGDSCLYNSDGSFETQGSGDRIAVANSYLYGAGYDYSLFSTALTLISAGFGIDYTEVCLARSVGNAQYIGNDRSGDPNCVSIINSQATLLPFHIAAGNSPNGQCRASSITGGIVYDYCPSLFAPCVP